MLKDKEWDYSSRKFRMAIGAMGTIFTATLLIYINPLFLEMYSTLVGGIVTIYGIYCGINVGEKWAMKNPPVVEPPCEETPGEED